MKTKNGGSRFAARKGVKKRLSLANQVLEKKQHRPAEQLNPPAKPQLKPASTKMMTTRKRQFPFLSKLAKIKNLNAFILMKIM